ncbi:MAG: rhodanese-like domain-containing protein [Flavobacteriaceae bacterium]
MKKLLLYSFLFLAVISCKKEEPSKVTLIQPEALAKVMSENSIQLVDVRTPEEYKRGYIEGAVLINFRDSNFLEQMESKLDKDKPVYVYCASGGRSGRASSLLLEKGFKKVFDLEGGYSKWSKK